MFKQVTWGVSLLQDLGFIRLWSKVETAHFKMRTDQLMLHEDFYVSLMELPEKYDFGMYSRFLNTFGTHYVTEGTMGGVLEYVYIVNKTAMAQSGNHTQFLQQQGLLGAVTGSNPHPPTHLQKSMLRLFSPALEALLVSVFLLEKACRWAPR